MLPSGESRWVCRRERQTDRQTDRRTDARPLHYTFRYGHAAIGVINRSNGVRALRQCSVWQCKCKCTPSNAYTRLNLLWPAAWHVAEWHGVHTVLPATFIHEWNEPSCMHFVSIHQMASPSRWRTSGSAYYSSIDPERMKSWVGLVGWPYSGWFTHVRAYPSATGRAWDRESSLVTRPAFYHCTTQPPASVDTDEASPTPTPTPTRMQHQQLKHRFYNTRTIHFEADDR